MPASVANRRLHFLGTHAVTTIERAAEIRDREFPPTAASRPTVAVLDLGGAHYTPAALRELVVPLGQRLRGGVFGELRIVLVAPDQATSEVVSLLAREHQLPFFIAKSSQTQDVEQAVPAGGLTPAEVATLDELREVGGGATAAGFAGAFGLSANTASNRLLNLERKGYLYRLHRSRREGDLYVDPRATAPDVVVAAAANSSAPPPRDALLSSGIRSNPYDRSRIELQGEAAERAAEVLRRRGKAQ